MKNDVKISEHLNEFNDVINQLESIGLGLEDKDKAMILLCTLPDSYNSLVMTLSLMSTKLQRKASFKFSAHDKALSLQGRSRKKFIIERPFKKTRVMTVNVDIMIGKSISKGTIVLLKPMILVLQATNKRVKNPRIDMSMMMRCT